MATGDITALSTPLSFPITGTYKFAERLSNNRFVVAWEFNTSEKYVQVFDVNRSTGVITPLGTRLLFYNVSYGWNSSETIPSISIISETEFVIFWTGASSDGFCRTFQVNAGTGEVTFWGSELEYDTSAAFYPSSITMSVDSSNAYILNTWVSSGDDGTSAIFNVDRSTGGISIIGTPYEFDTSRAYFLHTTKINNTKVLVAYNGGADDGFSVVLDINTSTWAVSNAGSSFEWLNNSTIRQNSLTMMTSDVALNAFYDNTSISGTPFGVRPLSINQSTWAISNLGSAKTGISTEQQHNQKRIVYRILDDLFIVFFVGTDNDGFVQTYTFDPSTGAIGSTAIDEIEFDTSEGGFQSAVDMGNGLFVNTWSSSGSTQYAQAFQVEIPEPPVSFNPHIARRRLLT